MATARVLVVDDDRSFLNAVCRMLRREGYEVLSAERPRRALEIVAAPPPIDLVVSDIVMPEMQGTQLVREVAELSPQTTSVLMTGGGINSAELPVGVPVLKKPFTRQDLLSTVQQCLERPARQGPIPDARSKSPLGYDSKARNSAPTSTRPFGKPINIIEKLQIRDKGCQSE